MALYFSAHCYETDVDKSRNSRREGCTNRIKDYRMEKYYAYIVFISKKHCRAEECLSRWEIDELSCTPPYHTPSFAPTDHPYTLSLYLLGRSVREPEGVGGRVQSLSISHPM